MYRIVTIFAFLILTATAATAQTFQAPAATPVVFTPPQTQAVNFQPPASQVAQPAFNQAFSVVQFQNNQFTRPNVATPVFVGNFYQQPVYDMSNSGGRTSTARNSWAKPTVRRPSNSRW